MANGFRCNCFITSALDVIGDKWSLVIVKHMLLGGKKTFKDLLESEEGIASSILASRLKKLEEFKIVTKRGIPENKKTKIYLLTDKGLALTPAIVELALWSSDHMAEFHASFSTDEHIERARKGRAKYADWVIKEYTERVREPYTT